MSQLKVKNDGKITNVHLEEYLNYVQQAIATLADRSGSSRARIMEFIKAQYKPHGLDYMVDANIFRAITYGVQKKYFIEVKPHGFKPYYMLAVPSVKKVGGGSGGLGKGQESGSGVDKEN